MHGTTLGNVHNANHCNRKHLEEAPKSVPPKNSNSLANKRLGQEECKKKGNPYIASQINFTLRDLAQLKKTAFKRTRGDHSNSDDDSLLPMISHPLRCLR